MQALGRVVVNGRFLAAPVTGVQRVARELVAHLPTHLGAPVEVVLPGAASRTVSGAPDLPQHGELPHVNGARAHTWEQVVLPVAARRLGARVVLNLCNAAPVALANSVLGISDTSPLTHPRFFSPTFIAYARRVWPVLARRAELVVTVSERSREDIARRLDVPWERIRVVPPAVSDVFSPPGARGRHDYCLVVGGHDRRKNVSFLVELWPEVRRRLGLELVVTRRTRSLPHGEPPPVPGVRVVDDPDDTTLVELYRDALCVLSPSTLEGFGVANSSTPTAAAPGPPVGPRGMGGRARVDRRRGARRVEPTRCRQRPTADLGRQRPPLGRCAGGGGGMIRRQLLPSAITDLAGPEGALGGAMATRIAPTVTKLALLAVVGRAGGLEPLGVFATVSALAFLLGSLAEMGFTTLFSVPERYIDRGLAAAIRGTRGLRIAAGAAGCAILLAAVEMGFAGGGADARWAVPLPLLIGLGLTQTGALNRLGMLRFEGRVAAAENGVALLAALASLLWLSPVAAALAGYGFGRAMGVTARAVRVRAALPSRTRAPAVRTGWRELAPFTSFLVVMVIHGQADVVLIGVLGSPVLAGVYAPILRLASVLLLVGEAVSLAALPRMSELAERPREEREAALGGALRSSWLVGLAGAAAVIVGGPLLLRLLIADPPSVPWTLFGLLAVVPLLRFPAHLLDAWLTGQGWQAQKTWVAAGSLAILLPAATAAVAAGTVTALATARVIAEVGLVAGWLGLARRSLTSAAGPMVDVR